MFLLKNLKQEVRISIKFDTNLSIIYFLFVVITISDTLYKGSQFLNEKIIINQHVKKSASVFE